MKSNVLPFACVCGLLALTACSKNDNSASAAAPAAAAESNVVSVELTAGDSMKYNVAAITAKPGEEVHVSLTNVGTMPKAAMAHNFILLKKDADVKAFTDAAVSAAATDYIPASQSAEIIAHTKLLGPKQSDEITFTAPTEPGDYPYLCSFPAHYAAGMHGVLTVK